jgi:hypothetical protein
VKTKKPRRCLEFFGAHSIKMQQYKNEDLRSKSTFTSSLLLLTYYFQKILNAIFSEK